MEEIIREQSIPQQSEANPVSPTPKRPEVVIRIKDASVRFNIAG
jgi:hypothetical protein